MCAAAESGFCCRSWRTFLGAGILLGPQAALGQHLMQFRIGGVQPGDRFEIFRGFRKATGAVTAEAQQRARLLAGRILKQRSPQRGIAA